MNALLEAPMNLYAAQLNAARRFVDACVAGTERLDRIFLEAAKDVLHTEIENAKAVAQCRTPQDFWSLAQTHGQPNYERIVARNTDMLREFAEFGTHAFNAAQGIAAQAQTEGTAAMTAAGAVERRKVADPFAQMMDFWQSSSSRMLEAMQPPARPAPKPASGGKSRAS
jgi:hypothetical protein